jgi:hypothetical protein
MNERTLYDEIQEARSSPDDGQLSNDFKELMLQSQWTHSTAAGFGFPMPRLCADIMWRWYTRTCGKLKVYKQIDGGQP